MIHTRKNGQIACPRCGSTRSSVSRAETRLGTDTRPLSGIDDVMSKPLDAITTADAAIRMRKTLLVMTTASFGAATRFLKATPPAKTESDVIRRPKDGIELDRGPTVYGEVMMSALGQKQT